MWLQIFYVDLRVSTLLRTKALIGSEFSYFLVKDGFGGLFSISLAIHYLERFGGSGSVIFVILGSDMKAYRSILVNCF